MACLVVTARGEKILASDLSQLLADPASAPLLIDIRPTADYRKGTIPGAINIPAQVLLEKKMNFRNGCILISDGIADKADPVVMADKLREKGVAKVDHLFGGIAAWAELSGATSTGGSGASVGRVSRTITYQDLEDRSGGVCFIDLRPDAERVPPKGHSCPVMGFCTNHKFHYCPDLPDFHRIHKGKSRIKRAGTGPLIVLIGGKETDTEAALNKLQIEGYRRSVVLLGGADIIAVDGRRGLKRESGKVIEIDGKEKQHAVKPEEEATPTK